MNYAELLQAARGQMGPCRACPVCNGRACGGNIPGPGAKGSGTVAIRNFDAWRNVRLNMDTIHENFTPDTSLQLFGRTFKYPFFAGPVGAMTLHYGDKYNDMDYNAILVPACAAAGIAAFTGDGTNPKVMEGATAAIAANGGFGIPTVKPWDNATVAKKMAMARESGCFALAMDIDAAGLPFLQNLTPPAGSKTVEQLQEIAREAGVPFILKGIMTAKGAEKAVQAGVAGDAFKALALGADAVLVARPYVTAVYGGGAEGVACLTEKLGAELADTMRLCGAAALKDISRDMVRV